MKKEGTSFRLSPKAREIIKRLATRLGISQASVVEMAVRLLEERLGEAKEGTSRDIEDNDQERRSE